MLKCIIARHKRPLISALSQPLAQPSGFLKCPTVFSLTYNSQVNVSLPSHPSSSWTITDLILTCVFNRLILTIYLRIQCAKTVKNSKHFVEPWGPMLGPSTQQEMILLNSQWIGESLRQCGLSEQGCAQMAINPTKSCCPLSIMSHNPFLFWELNRLSVQLSHWTTGLRHWLPLHPQVMIERKSNYYNNH